MLQSKDELCISYGPLSSLSCAFDCQLQTMNATVEKWQQGEIQRAAQLRIHMQVHCFCREILVSTLLRCALLVTEKILMMSVAVE